jgi:TolA-binding protein
MRNEIRLGLYVVLLAGACVFGSLALSSYKRIMHQPSDASQANLTEVPALHKDDGPRTSLGYARMLTCGAFFFASVVGLGLLVGHDVSHHLGNRVLRGLYNDEGEGIADPEYDAAEQVWADGKYLDAIGMMREYLKRNPREQHVALRIAEIYEKDLANPLAAALEYEEVLKQKLPAERWGWAAIHLCNLYGKLDQQDKSVALLRRLDAEYNETAAAEKARKRLEDLGFSTQVEELSQAQEAPRPEPTSGGVKLPPGFTLKKS